MVSSLLTLLGAILLILATAAPAAAQNRLRSHTTELGDMTITTTTGTLDGQRVNIRERTSSVGSTQRTQVKGTIGRERVNLSVRESPFASGTRSTTTGRVGEERWNLTTRSTPFGGTERRTITGNVGPSRINTTVRQREFGNTITSDVSGRRNGERINMTVRTTQSGAGRGSSATSSFSSTWYPAVSPSPTRPVVTTPSSPRTLSIRTSPPSGTLHRFTGASSATMRSPSVIHLRPAAPPAPRTDPWIQGRYIADLGSLPGTARSRVERARNDMAPVLRQHSLRYAVLQVGTFARGSGATHVMVRSGGHTATYRLNRSGSGPWATYLEEDGLLVIPVDPNRASSTIHVCFY